MKRKIILLSLFGYLGLLTATGQIIVGSVNINNLDIQYIEMLGYNRPSNAASIWLDFGQNYDPGRSGEFLKPINDQERVRFRSLLDALNYFYKNGWELVQAYAVGEFHHYVLQRKSRINK
jgi:hypothetical protein